jgi:hypothetical protein
VRGKIASRGTWWALDHNAILHGSPGTSKIIRAFGARAQSISVLLNITLHKQNTLSSASLEFYADSSYISCTDFEFEIRSSPLPAQFASIIFSFLFETYAHEKKYFELCLLVSDSAHYVR